VPIPVTSLDEMRELVALCRELGVVRMKTGETEIMLGEEPGAVKKPKAPREKPLAIREPLKNPTQTSASGTPRSDDVMFPKAGGRA
jgi:hypothetical protein